MKQIKLTNSPDLATVDDDDYERLNRYRWFLAGGYPTRCAGKLRVTMHAEVLGRRPGFVIDHASRNRLDNRKSNLRHATYTQNGVNRVRPPGPSGFRGVRVKKGRYFAETRRIRLGDYATAEEAAAVYNWAVLQLYGRFAVTNRDAGGNVLAPVPASKPEPLRKIAALAVMCEEGGQGNDEALAPGSGPNIRTVPHIPVLRSNKHLLLRGQIYWYQRKLPRGAGYGRQRIKLGKVALKEARRLRDDLERQWVHWEIQWLTRRVKVAYPSVGRRGDSDMNTTLVSTQP